MITIAICDDDKSHINSLKNMINEWNYQAVIAEYNSAEQFLFSYTDKHRNLLLLDIEMGNINGMELARNLRAKGDMLPIIFITGYSEFMQDSYDFEDLHYLLKSVNKNKLLAVLDRYTDCHKADSRVILPIDDESVCVNSDDIVYL